MRFFKSTSRAFNHLSVGYRLLFSQRGVAAKNTLGWKVWRHDEKIWELGRREGQKVKVLGKEKEGETKKKLSERAKKWNNDFFFFV